ncbi:hypothetical protein PRK78_006484 [Emydomyces testavorans]|uniref:Uncharacterized protein n=1 Tax=Emydomyces testavorans TaxID=2070801 RepID=A0AAF0DQB1_9EURO|nr:hypothetical protein PRK78_006484 [Emydomyces testavorans]
MEDEIFKVCVWRFKRLAIKVPCVVMGIQGVTLPSVNSKNKAVKRPTYWREPRSHDEGKRITDVEFYVEEVVGPGREKHSVKTRVGTEESKS